MVDFDGLFTPKTTVEKALVNSDQFWEAISKLPPDEVLEVAEEVCEILDVDEDDIQVSGVSVHFDLHAGSLTISRKAEDKVVATNGRTKWEGGFSDAEEIARELREAPTDWPRG